MRTLPLLFLLSTSVAAQGVLPLAETYHFAGLELDFDDACGCSAVPTIVASGGSLTLALDGSAGFSVTDEAICPGGSVQASSDTGSGTYAVRGDGVIAFDWNAASPGVDLTSAFLRANGSAFLVGRNSEEESDAAIALAIALSSGQSNATLTGRYHLLRMVNRNGVAGFSTSAWIGTATFDGVGAYTEAGTQHDLSLGGAPASSAATGSGSYAVAADGVVTAGAARGVVSADGELFFWSSRAGPDYEFTVGLRQAGGRTTGQLNGTWGIAQLDAAIAATRTPAEMETAWGSYRFGNTGGGTASLFGDVLDVGSLPQIGGCPFTSGSQYQFQSSVAINGVGQLSASPGATPFGAVSADGSVLFTLTVPGDAIGIALGLSRCSWPGTIGAGTAGTGAAIPSLFTVGGFPFLGNAAFGYVAAGGRGGGAAALVLSTAALSSGLPLLGGTLWIDPTRLVASFPQLLSGPPGVGGIGAAGWSLPLPVARNGTALTLASQVIVLDPAAPGGVAMSPAVVAQPCR